MNENMTPTETAKELRLADYLGSLAIMLEGLATRQESIYVAALHVAEALAPESLSPRAPGAPHPMSDADRVRLHADMIGFASASVSRAAGLRRNADRLRAGSMPVSLTTY